MERGFTLIEVLVSITVLLFVVFLPMAIIAEYITTNNLGRQQVIAQLRAQEAIELVRLDRDNLTRTTGGWFDMISAETVQNPYAACVERIDEGTQTDQVERNRVHFCYLNCVGVGIRGSARRCDSLSNPGFVWGVGTGTRAVPNDATATISQTGRSNTETCDGLDPKADGGFTSTLTILIPDEEDHTQFATITPCVSWQRDNGNIERVELSETLYEWVKH